MEKLFYLIAESIKNVIIILLNKFSFFSSLIYKSQVRLQHSSIGRHTCSEKDEEKCCFSYSFTIFRFLFQKNTPHHRDAKQRFGDQFCRKNSFVQSFPRLNQCSVSVCGDVVYIQQNKKQANEETLWLTFLVREYL